MKILRLFLVLAGIALMIWGALDYLSEFPQTRAQALPKIVLGVLGALAALLAKSRR